MSALTPDEAERYKRHILLKEIGGAGQQRLRGAVVALVGVGGLGAPAALYLAAAGVGKLILIDNDTVALSNLQRQVIFRSQDIDSQKAGVAAEALGALNPGVRVDAHDSRLDEHNARDLLAAAHVVLDGSDSFETRFIVNTVCHMLRVPLVSGAVGRWDGQVGVFASGVKTGAPCYRCLVPDAPPDAVPCAAQGIIGALPGVIGAAMALEAIKIITRAGTPLIGRLMLYDALQGDVRVTRIVRDPECPVCSNG